MINRADLITLNQYLEDLERDIREFKAAQTVGASTLEIVRNVSGNTYDYEADVPAYYSIMGALELEFEKQDNPYAEMIMEIYMNGVRQFVGNGNYISDPYSKRPIYPQSVGTPRNYRLLAFSVNVTNNTSGTNRFQLKFIVPASDKVLNWYPSFIVGQRQY